MFLIFCVLSMVVEFSVAKSVLGNSVKRSYFDLRLWFMPSSTSCSLNSKVLLKFIKGKRMVTFGNFYNAILFSLWASFVAVQSFCFRLLNPSDRITVLTGGLNCSFSSTLVRVRVRESKTVYFHVCWHYNSWNSWKLYFNFNFSFFYLKWFALF